MTNEKGNFYSGTSGLVLPVPNKASYPPQFQNKTRLTYYASLFNSIEINSSFYKIPQAKTVSKWASEVPDGFKFTFKLWQDITHQKGLVFNPDDISRFMQVIAEAGDKKGSLLIQFPPSIKSDGIRQLENLLSCIRNQDESNQWDISVEFRHKSWYSDKTYELLDQYQMGIVIHDLPASASPLEILDSRFIYLRFHGPNGGYRGSYTDDFLSEYATYITEWLANGKTVYAYFNNTMGDAVHNLTTLNEYVKAGQL
jgi:uncharacterized protein YecE (DUF72 family)